jgi:hypothetical protein
MVMRRTPFQRIRYPWTADVVNVADVQSMGSDIDQALVQTATLADNFTRFSSVIVRRAAAQSLTKATLTAISWDTVVLDNGTDSPLANGPWWAAGTPTRLTAPAPCIVLASATAGVSQGSAWGSPAALQVTVALNGAVAAPGVQGAKYNPPSAMSGQTANAALTMWRLAAGDYLELKLFWTGTPAGPINTDTTLWPQLALMQVALPSVP